MTSQDEADFANFNFETEVSARYHDYRRGTLERYVSLIRLTSLLGSIVAFIAVSIFVEGDARNTLIIELATILIGTVNLFDLVFGVDARARRHEQLYQRFKELQIKMLRKQTEWAKYLPEWQIEAKGIHVDEPATYWAVYNSAWNQMIERYRLDESNKRVVSRWQKLTKNIRHYNPEDFKPVSLARASSTALNAH